MKWLKSFDKTFWFIEIFVHAELIFVLQATAVLIVLKQNSLLVSLFLLCFLAHTYCYVWRKIIPNFFVFVFVTAGFISVLYGLYQIGTIPGIWLVLSILIMIESFILRFSKSLMELERPGFFQIGILCFNYFLSIILKAIVLGRVVFVLTAITLLFKCVYDGMCSTQAFIQQQRHTAFVPVKQIKQINKMLLALYISCTVAAMSIFSLLPLNGVVEKLGAGLLFVLRSVLGILFHNTKESPVTTESGGDGISLDALGTGDETAPIWEYLNQILQVIGIFLLICMILAFLVFCLYQWYQNFYQKKGLDSDRSEFISPFEKGRLNRKKSPKRSIFFRSNPKEKIRRFYRGRIRVSLGSGRQIPMSSTPKEQGEMAEFPKDENTNELLSFYYLARYGDSTCTKEDVKRMKELCQISKQRRRDR